MRVVATTCSNTEIVCALGCADRLVGVDQHSDYPEEVVRALPRVGPDLGVDVAKVAALRPDLVLASLTVPGHERVVESLERAGLPVVAPAPTSLADVYADIRHIAELLGVPGRGAALVEDLERAMVPEPVARRPAILVEWWPKPVVVPGARSWVTDLLHLAGASNPFGSEAVKSRALEPQDVAGLEAEAVVISWCGVPAEKYRPRLVLERPGWQHVPAVQHRRVHCVPEAFLGRPGPRLVEGYRRLRAIAAALRDGRPPG